MHLDLSLDSIVSPVHVSSIHIGLGSWQVLQYSIRSLSQPTIFFWNYNTRNYYKLQSSSAEKMCSKHLLMVRTVKYGTLHFQRKFKKKQTTSGLATRDASLY